MEKLLFFFFCFRLFCVLAFWPYSITTLTARQPHNTKKLKRNEQGAKAYTGGVILTNAFQ
jgi:hypothetical protein